MNIDKHVKNLSCGQRPFHASFQTLLCEFMPCPLKVVTLHLLSGFKMNFELKPSNFCTKLYNGARINRSSLPVDNFDPAVSVSEAYYMYIVLGLLMLLISYSFVWMRKRFYGEMVL